ncbi:hypothetical protein L6452_38313 [Arctium lappa]|uniref:Uncharacterized protein n=1 Tax=Arctium lappa TaxID=4217 RepID=A0ACB8Y5D9_ARCLA|nr:hypothetical protein L6452_38313 [Arctium lappa]
MRFFASGYAIKIKRIESSGVLSHKDSLYRSCSVSRKEKILGGLEKSAFYLLSQACCALFRYIYCTFVCQLAAVDVFMYINNGVLKLDCIQQQQKWMLIGVAMEGKMVILHLSLAKESVLRKV